MEQKIDRSKPYGLVFGEPDIAFEQGGKYYRHDGTLFVRPEGTPPPLVNTEEAQRELLTLRKDKLREAYEKIKS